MMVSNISVMMLVLLPMIYASCPNKCSGHGACGTNDVCTCKQNWMGGDCSLRVCPYTRAWVDAPVGTNDAHYYAECGNKGSCDRATGICVCDPGYTGSGCRRQACPNACSGHGTCESIEEFSTNTYTAWDQQKSYGCKCDPFYEGHDCSSKICPKGDDPVTSYDQNTMVQYISATLKDGSDTILDLEDDKSVHLIYTDPYGNAWTTGAVKYGSFCANVQKALRQIPNHALDDVVVSSLSANYDKITVRTGSSVSKEGVTIVDKEIHCKVIFPSAAGTTGLQNLLQFGISSEASGHQPVVDVHDSGSMTFTVGEFFDGDGDIHALTELATCSNRGICDETTGDCQCFAGHRGLACETQEALV